MGVFDFIIGDALYGCEPVLPLLPRRLMPVERARRDDHARAVRAARLAAHAPTSGDVRRLEAARTKRRLRAEQLRIAVLAGGMTARATT